MNTKPANIAFRTTTDIQSRLFAVAEAEHLSVSDIVRRAALKQLNQLEKEHSIADDSRGLIV